MDQAAMEFRQHYYGPDNNPVPPAAMAELAPEVMRLVDSVIYGEIYNRPAVDLKTRSLCTIAALVVLGHSPQMIRRHISGALHIGVTREEISEIIAQMIFYGGMPAAVQAFQMAKEAFDASPDGLDAEHAPAEPENTVRYKEDDAAYGAAPPPPAPEPEESNDDEPESRLRAVEQPPMTAERPQRRPSDMSRRERDEVRFHRDRQHGESHGRQSDQSRPSANRPRPSARGRNQPAGDGRTAQRKPSRATRWCSRPSRCQGTWKQWSWAKTESWKGQVADRSSSTFPQTRQPWSGGSLRSARPGASPCWTLP